MEVNEILREERMIKGWKDMTPEQKQTEKCAMVVMTIMAAVIALLFLLAGGLVQRAANARE